MNAPHPAPRRRWLWIFLGGILVGIAVICGLLLAPPVQGWLLRRLVASQPGWKLDFERIGLGPTGLDARGLEFSMPGVKASSAPIAIQIAPTRLLSKRELRVEQVNASKVRITLTPAQLPATPPFDGLLKLLQAPLPWALDAAQIDGEIVVDHGAQSRVTGAFTLSGGGLSSATPGFFSYKLAADSTLLPPGSGAKLTSAGAVRIAQTNTHGIARLTLEGDLRFPRYDSFSLPDGQLTLDVVATPEGESYTGSLAIGLDAFVHLDATLDAARSRLTGKVTLHADPSLAGRLSDLPLPNATSDGELTFSLNLRNADLDVAFEGDLTLRDWQKVLPRLAVLDAFEGHLSAGLVRRGDQTTVHRLTGILRGENSLAEAQLRLTRPFDPLAHPSAPVATLSLAHWPARWAHSSLGSAEFSGAWTVTLQGNRVLRLAPSQPTVVGPLAMTGDFLGPLSPMALSLSPQLEASADGISLGISDLAMTTATRDRIAAKLSVVREAKTGEISVDGDLRGDFPTLLAGKETSLPLLVEARVGARIDGNAREIRVSSLEVSARSENEAKPYLAIDLLSPFDFDLEKFAPVQPRVVAATPIAGAGATLPSPAASLPDGLRMKFHDLPLAWISRWRPSQKIGGNLTAEVTAAIRGKRLSGAIEGLDVALDSGNRVGGRVAFAADLAEKSGAAEASLDADIPSLPADFAAVGPLQATLQFKAQTGTRRILLANEFALRLRHSGGELLTAIAQIPILFGLSDSGMIALTTVDTLPIRLGAIPLSWLRPWTGTLELVGKTSPTDFVLTSNINRHSLRPLGPVNVEIVSARDGDREFIRDATLSFQPALDLLFIGVVEPKFVLAYTGSLYLTDGRFDSAGSRALDLDFNLAFTGTEKTLLPSTLNLTSRLDFAAAAKIPAASMFDLPSRGSLVTRVNGNLLGGKPVEIWTRLSGLANPEAPGTLPPLELTLNGKISRDQIFAAGAELLLATTPKPTDARFSVDMNLAGGVLNLTSGLRSQFFDGKALLTVAQVFNSSFQKAAARKRGGPRSVGAGIGAAPRSPGVSRKTRPFWTVLRGSFDLDLGAVQWGVYRIDHVHGRLDASDHALVLRDLGGEMFSGRWAGNMRVDHEPANLTGRHKLTADFRIEQFESARVAQTVFRDQIASIDALLNLRASVSSQGDTLPALIDRSEVDFTLHSEKGVLRLTVPKSDLVSTAAVFGGTVLLSPELRALGRLLRRFAEMPVDQLSISGRRAAGGEVRLDEFRFESPQARLIGHGRVEAMENQPLMNRPLELSLQLAAKDELAVILGGMSLLEKKPMADGFRAMRQPFYIGGRAGEPDTAPFYDLLARAVSGSRGTWGFLMRKVQADVKKRTSTQATTAP